MVDALLAHPRTAAVEPRWRAIADAAIALTERPTSLSEAHIDRLRSHALSDAGVHDVVAIIAYFNFVNRLAEGLHIPIEGGE